MVEAQGYIVFIIQSLQDLTNIVSEESYSFCFMARQMNTHHYIDLHDLFSFYMDCKLEKSVIPFVVSKHSQMALGGKVYTITNTAHAMLQQCPRLCNCTFNATAVYTNVQHHI